jgi:hypothetical protein
MKTQIRKKQRSDFADKDNCPDKSVCAIEMWM